MRRTSLLLACLLCVGLASAACARLTPNRRHQVPSAAMEPSIKAGDTIGCSTQVPDTLRRGMVVLFSGDGNFAARPGLTFVKRVVGLPGERIASADGRVVTVNGEPLAEPYLAGSGSPRPFPEVTVPEGAYFLLGDNRAASSDSREHGAVPRDAVQEVCTRIVAPRDHKRRIPGT